MKTFTMADIRSWEPCYDPAKYLPENWRGTVIDILNLKECPFEDRLWVALRTELLSEKLMRLFAVWCARQVQHLMKDERSIRALDVAEAFACGNATLEELDAARAAAWAAWAARAAAATAWDARAAWAAAATAWDARAAWAARDARAAAWAAAAWDARESAWGAQEKKLREMIEAGIKTGDVK